MCADHQRCDENAHEAARKKTADKDEEQHPSLGLLQRREFLLDGSPDLRLLGIGAVGRDHRECHAGVAEIGDRISSLPWKRERGRLHALPCLGREFRHAGTYPSIHRAVKFDATPAAFGVAILR